MDKDCYCIAVVGLRGELCGDGHESRVWVEPKAIEAKRAASAPDLGLSVINSLDISYGAH